MNSPLLFKVFLRPSFGACAPPSPNSARNLYFLRRVGRLLMIIQASGDLFRRLAPLSPKGKAFPQSVKTFNDNSGKRRPLSAPCATLPKGKSLPFWGRCRLCRRKRSLRREVFPLGGLYVSFYLIWRKCRRCETLLSTEIKNGKEGLFQIKNRRAISIKTNS